MGIEQKLALIYNGIYFVHVVLQDTEMTIPQGKLRKLQCKQKFGVKWSQLYVRKSI